ncbi:hypothetical protein SAMN02910289_01286 [Lachnospiraceae bacterium RM5]|nr:hypothetical protein SAMN02910289_01286 [Lachnospiraceae bacterium RM5]
MSYRQDIENFLADHPYNFVRIGKSTFKYIFTGSFDKPCLVFFNNGLNSLEMWFEYLTELSSEYTTLVFDYPEDLTTCDSLIDNISLFLAKLRIKHSYFIGDGIGGLLVQMYALKYPAYVNGMALITSRGLNKYTIKNAKKDFLKNAAKIKRLNIGNYEKYKLSCVDEEIKKYTLTENSEGREIISERLKYLYSILTKEKEILIKTLEMDIAKQKDVKQEKFAYFNNNVTLMYPETDYFDLSEKTYYNETYPNARIVYFKNRRYGLFVEKEKCLEIIRSEAFKEKAATTVNA